MNTVIDSIKLVNRDYLDIETIEDVIDLENMFEQLENIRNRDKLNVYFNESIPSKWKHIIAHNLLYQNWQFRNTGFKIIDVLYDEDRNINGFVMECNVDDIYLPNNNIN